MSENLDDLLKGALRRVEAPPDFAARVMARLDGEPEKVNPARFSSSWRMFGALAATVALLAAGALRLRYDEQTKEEHGRELVFALQLASSKLAAVDARLRHNAVALHTETNAKEVEK